MSTAKFAELRCHSAYSFGDGVLAAETLVEHAAELGYDAIGITDLADFGAIVRAKLTADQVGVKLIAGVELRVEGLPVALLARNVDGCRNIAALITRARAGAWRDWSADVGRRRRGQPVVSTADLLDRAGGVQLLTGPASGPIATLVREGRAHYAVRLLHEWRERFDGHVAIEVQRHNTGGDDAALAGALVDLARHANVPWVVAGAPRYVDDDGRLVHDMLTALRAGVDLDAASANGILHPNGEWRLRSPESMRLSWEGLEDGVEESARIAEECEGFAMRWLRPPLPDFPRGGYDDLNRALRERTYEGARVRWGETLTHDQRRQIEHELEVIGRLGFGGFFLVMWDAVNFAHGQNILCQGRGSAANSAVAYCLGITAVDPVANGLLFERFLSEVRVPNKIGEYTEAPDIDVDIEHTRREEVLDYMYSAYDRSKSAIACIVQMYRAPNALLDSMRALGYPAEIATQISKRLHHYDPAEGAEAVKGELAKRFGVDLDTPRGRAILTAMRTLEGVPRMRSTHVGGFVLSSQPLGDYLPIEPTAMGRTIVQFDKDDLDIIGVPKFDFLGLGALSHVRRAFQEIARNTGETLTLYGLPHDPGTYEMISEGDTIGTFQIESRAQIASILNTRPEKLYDIVVQVALIRPGPIQGEFVHPYTRRRRGFEQPSYAHPLLEPILRRTQGIPIFQEQAMAIATTLGGFTGGEADRLRRTMGNIRKKGKLESVLKELVDRMVGNEAVEPRVGVDVAQGIARDLLTFANYGFPESHAWSFALIAYATAYIKHRYPTEFYFGLLNAQPMGFYPNSTLIHEARRRGVEVLSPCLARGGAYCTTEQGSKNGRALRIGWRHVRGVGEQTIERIEAISAKRPFESIEDVVKRALLTPAEAVQFARAAAFEIWEPDRRRAAWEALRAAGDVLPLAPSRHTPYEPRALDEHEQIFLDYAATGICVTGHPMQHLRPTLRSAGIHGSAALATYRAGAPITVAGLVTVRQRPASAGGTIFLLMEDEDGFINVIVPKQLVDRFADVVKFASFVVAEGRFERDGRVMNVVGARFRELKVQNLRHHIHSFK